MKYQKSQSPSSKTITLQSVGHVIANFASEIKVGDSLMWNFGSVSKVTNITKQTDKTVWIEETTESGYVGVRRMAKNRKVCILKK